MLVATHLNRGKAAEGTEMSSSFSELVGTIPPWAVGFRASLVEQASNHPLFQRLAEGDREALEVVLERFWPFVVEFPGIIRDSYQRHIREIRSAVSRKTLKTITTEMQKMRNEEGDHTKAWIALGESIGVQMPDPSIRGRAIEVLIRYGNNDDAAKFFVLLHVTEIVASIFATAGLKAAQRIRLDATWFTIHEHGPVPGHEELDFFLACQILRSRKWDVEQCFRKFGLEAAFLFKVVAEGKFQ